MTGTERSQNISSRQMRFGLLGVLALSVLFALICTRSWPLVGDTALMHYVVFLIRRGAVPYREIVDINLPGTFFFEDAGMRLFGNGALGLRLYDWFLVVCIAAGCLGLSGRKKWFAGVFSGLFFALVHVQDGLAQQGQRDLLLAALLLAGAATFRLMLESTKHSRIAAFAFGLTFGVSFTIKPVLLPLCLALLALGLWRKTCVRSPAPFLLSLLGMLAPGLLAAFWLIGRGAFDAFLSISRSLAPLHAALGRRSLSYLLGHSFSPLGFLLLCALVLLFIDRARSIPHRLLFALSLSGTLFGYAVQGKGYPYQRYPLLVLLLLVIGFVIDHALDAQGRPHLLAMTMVLWAAALGVYFAWRPTRFGVQTPTVTALSQQLASYGTPGELNGKVQCLDMFGGCINTLYDLGIRQSTGFLYDCYLFTQPSAERSAYRKEFWDEFQKTQPEWVVLSSQNCFKDATNGYDRLNLWPEFNIYLHEHYQEVNSWTPTGPVSWFSQKQMPSGFKILARHEGNGSIEGKAEVDRGAK